jgi:hypothetical protein
LMDVFVQQTHVRELKCDKDYKYTGNYLRE